MTRQGNFKDKVFLSQRVGINRYQLCFYFLSAFILLYIQVTLRIPVVNYMAISLKAKVFSNSDPTPQITRRRSK